MKYYVVTNSPFSERDKERFGVNFFLSKGWSVEVIDVTGYLFPQIIEHVESNKNIDSVKPIKCNSFANFRFFFLKAEPNSLVYLALGNSFKEQLLIFYLGKHNFKIGFAHVGLLPAFNSQIAKHQFFIDKLKKVKFQVLVSRVLSIFTKHILLRKPFDFFITANLDTARQNYSLPKFNQLILSHSRDYDLYKEIINDNSSIVQGKYVVFLDQHLTRHSDFLRAGVSTLDEKTYFENLNAFFQTVEEKHGLKVVIALHPRADEDYGKLFGDRLCVKSKTEWLVKDAEFVIMHYSTAINFAILFKKPIIFVYNQDFQKLGLERYVITFAQEVLGTLINLSVKYEFPLKLEPSWEAYEAYCGKYIKTKNSMDKSFWQIFYEEFCR